MINNRLSGFTLVELLVVLALTTILLSQAIPGIESLLNRSGRHGAVGDIVSLLNLARNTAVHEQQTVTLCPLGADNRCTNNWSQPITAFRDPSRTKTVLAQSQIIRVTTPPKHGRLTVKSGIHNYFRFRSDGMASGAIGHFIWCPDNNDNSLAAQIRINMGGRPQVARDNDGDGVAEDAYGKPLTCEG